MNNKFFDLNQKVSIKNILKGMLWGIIFMIIISLIFYLIFIFPTQYDLWQKEKEYKKLDEEFNKYMQEKKLKNEINEIKIQ
jgi:TM2 domain-containing membrane protein YozV